MSLKRSLYTRDDEHLQLNFHKGQYSAWKSERRYVFVIAGTQGGKTSFGPWWLHREIMRCGPGDYIAATSSYDLFKLKMLPEIRRVFEDVLGCGKYWPGERVIEIADPATGQFSAKRASDQMWARIILRSAAAEGGLESATAKAAWLDEVGQDDFSVSAWQAVERRVSLNRGRVLGTTTPYNLGWMKQLIYDRWLAGDPEISVVQFRSDANPLFSPDEMAAAKKRLPLWKYKMFYEGVFTRPAGMIYADFIDAYVDDGGHKIKAFTPPATMHRVVGIDPGAVNTAKVYLAVDKLTKTAYCYRESLTGGKSTKEHAREVMDLLKSEGTAPNRTYIGSKGEVQVRLDYKAAGMARVYEPPVADVEAGIDRVIQLLKEGRLLISDSCTGLLAELMSYSRVVTETGEMTAAIHNKSEYHRLDALRYACAGVDAPLGVVFA